MSGWEQRGPSRSGPKDVGRTTWEGPGHLRGDSLYGTSNHTEQRHYPKEHEEIFNPTTRHAQSASPPLEQRELGSPLFRGSCGCDSPRSTKAAAVPERVGGLPGPGGAAEHSPHCRGCSTMGWDVRGLPQHRGMGHEPVCFWGCWWCWERLVLGDVKLGVQAGSSWSAGLWLPCKRGR